MPADLTPDEISFFETGELPASLATEAASAAAEVETPAVETAATEVAAAVEVPKVEAPDPFAAFEERMNNLFSQKIDQLKAQFTEASKPAQAVVEVPDEETDPLGNMMHQLKTVNETVKNLETQTQQAQQQAQMQKQINEFVQSVQEAKAEFIKTTPDFSSAYEHIRQLRTADMKALGLNDTDIKQALLQDEFRLSETALARGANPAEEMYKMAKRYGYTPTAAPAAKVTAAPAKMAQLQSGADAARQPGKAAVDVPLTLAGLSDASNADLNKMVQDDKMWATIVGGAGGSDIFP